MVTDSELGQIMPNLPADKRALYIAPLQAAMNEFGINTYLREAAFLAQLAHESMELKAWSENLNYSAQGLLKVFPKYFKTSALANAYARQPQKIASRVYASRMGNGDEASGEGWKYRGRGPIQLTGKSNYTAYGQTLSLDLVGNPDSVATPEVGFRVAAAFWNSNGLNALADRQDFVGITRKINGGTNGLDDRTRFYNRAKQVLSRDDAPAGATRGLPGRVPPPPISRAAATDAPPNLSRGILPGASSTLKMFGGAHDPVRGADDDGGGTSKSSAKKSGTKKGGSKKSAQTRTTKKIAENDRANRSQSDAQKSSRGSASKKGGGKKGASKKSVTQKGAAKKGGARPLAVIKKEGARGGSAGKQGGGKKGGAKKGGGGSKKGGGKKGGSKKGR